MTKTFMKINKKLFRTYVMDVLGSVYNCNTEYVLDDKPNDLLGPPKEWYKTWQEVEYGRLRVDRN